MPFALLITGAVLLISAARGTVTQGPNGGPGLFTLIESDFTGQNNFIFWFVAILAVGSVGYIPKLKPLSVAFLTLVIISLFLRKGTGFFAQALQGISGTQSASPSVATPSGSTAGITTGSAASLGGSSLTSLIGGIESNNPVLSSPVTTSLPSPVPSGLQFPLLNPSGNPTDLSFPSLGIGA